ncbi:MAG TPA: hypothetical protein EYN06_07660 [Myxococcales bacterium]|nr:hypothetical protein [Myxococcales bacterium]
MKAFDTGCKSPSLMLNINTRKKGDVTAAFTAYSSEANYALLQETTKPLQKHLPPGAVWLLSRYPKLTQCTQ